MTTPTTEQVIVIGASTGGIEALQVLVAGLPADFATPICVVWHISPHAPGVLHQILRRAGNLPAFKVESALPLNAPGIYVAPPDFHLMVDKGMARVTRGPRENRFRPAIDPLFRSAAYSYGPGAIGVVLSGNLDDGTSGLWAIKDQGGIAIAQDPAEAMFPSMPRSAIQNVAVDHIVPIAELPQLLVALTARSIEGSPSQAPSRGLETEVRIANGHDAREVGVLKLGQPSTYTCPECHGVLLEVKDSGVPRFRCHTGHAYSVESLAAALFEGINDNIWSVVRALDEGGSLLEELARHLEEHDEDQRAAILVERAREAKQRADHLRRFVARGPGDE
jgi:two-component system chemotaxis response regulator CheB